MSRTLVRQPLAPGARVVIRDEEWLVLGTNPANCGGEAVRVRGLSELVRDRETLAPSNAALVTRAVALCEKYDRPVADWKTARRILRLRAPASQAAA